MVGWMDGWMVGWLVYSRVDPVGGLAALLAVLAGRVPPPAWLTRHQVCLAAVATATVGCTLLFVCVVGVFHLDFDNWSGVDKFFPHGLRGVRTYYRSTHRLPSASVCLHAETAA